MAGHAVLEAARDALFLATLPPSLLPWAYLAMAVLALLVARVNRAALEHFSRARTLAITLLGGSVITLAFWFLSSLRGSASALVGFYVWTGLLATVVVVQFWLQLSEVLDIGQAKRVFAWIGAGGLLGAALGSACASLVLMATDARALVVVAAGFYAVSSLLPFAFWRGKSRALRPSRFRSSDPSAPSELRLLLSTPYLQRLMVILLTSTVIVTGVDFVFKASVHAAVPANELGPFFARYYAVINALALLVQVIVAPRLLRTSGLNRALLVMPVLLLAAAGGFVFSGSLVAVIGLRAVDGVLRHSLNRTATEILYVPLSSRIREQFKSFSEAVGQRGGQALASLLILAAIALGVEMKGLGWALLVLSAVWAVCILGLQSHYLDLFRTFLRDGTLDSRADVPELDLRTLETLMAALSSEHDGEVVAALDMFAAYDRVNLIPALIVFHPSPAVVLRAFELFTDAERADLRPLAARLLNHADHDVRAAAVRAYVARSPDEEVLRARLVDSSPAVRISALVGMVSAGFVTAEQASAKLREIVHDGSAEARQALALSLRFLPAGLAAELAPELVRFRDPALSGLVARSLAATPDPRHVPLLIELLAVRPARAEARAGLVKLGHVALDALEAAMRDAGLPRAIRRHLPRTISRFSGPRPAALLAGFLQTEADEAVAFKILRGLGRMRENEPNLALDVEPLLNHTRATLERAILLLYFRRVLALAEERDPGDPVRELLSALLNDLQTTALERVFRLLHIVKPTEEFAIIYAGLASEDRKTRATGRELLDNIVPEPLRAGLLPLVDELPEVTQLELAAAFFEPPGYGELRALSSDVETGEVSSNDPGAFARVHANALHGMMRDRSRVLRSVAQHHAESLGLTTELSASAAAEVTTPADAPRPVPGEPSRDATDPSARVRSAAHE